MTDKADRERAEDHLHEQSCISQPCGCEDCNAYRAYIEVVGENERLRALLLAVQSLVCPTRSDGFYQESIANLLADEGEKS